ncbi:UNVERIFIED_ORG: type VI secretion system protein VasL [Buttiauxella agrestis ATCC 33320]
MNDTTSHPVKTGGDPRTLADFAALREELSKLTHPARPDVDWRRVEQLSLSLFRQNGVELQTAAWYTLARTHQAGMSGLNEGLAILEALLTHQWGAMWPQPVHARMEILSGLSQRLQSVLRTISLSYTDLPLVYQAGQHLNALRDVLQRLELKNASQMGELCTFMHNAATRLENTDASHTAPATVVRPPAASASPGPSETLVYVVHQESVTPRIEVESPEPEPGCGRPWKSFTAGMLTMLVVGGCALWGWKAMHPAEVAIIPVAANEASLTELGLKSPLWLQNYGFVLADKAAPANVDKLKTQWQQHIAGNALPVETLSGWHQGMEGLQDMTRRLNALDERKGKYLTGSELKSMVFTITQNFASSVPSEELLYQLDQVEAGTPLPASLVSQTDLHLNQLLNRYTLIKQQAITP